jgi:hypothetical protein
MEGSTYYLASLRLSGWMSKTGQYTSDITQAREFNHMEALTMAKRQKDGGNNVVPVEKADMDFINGVVG